jgi:hypothetical protein
MDYHNLHKHPLDLAVRDAGLGWGSLANLFEFPNSHNLLDAFMFPLYNLAKD